MGQVEAWGRSDAALLAAAACTAYLRFADLAERVCSIARAGVKPDLLRWAVHAFLAAFVAAFGEDALIPKSHWLLHYGRELARHGTLLACFVHERKQ